jgi:heterotetrameric sarcosine oxidase gamma subunit
MTSPLKHSALYDVHAAHRAAFATVADWRVPARYGDPRDEARRVREGVGVIDRSDTGKFEIAGRRLGAWIAQRFGDEGAVAPMQACRVAVDVHAPGLWCRLREDRGMLLISPEHATSIHAILALSTGEGVHLTEVTPVYTALQIAGPQSIPLLRKLTPLDLRPARFPPFACAQAMVAKVRALVVRDDLGDLPSFWLLVTRDYGEFVWETLLHTGAGLGIAPFGYEAYERVMRDEG